MKFSEQFTSREIEAIEKFAEGFSSAEAADLLGISAGTVRAHRKNILQKSGCKNITEVVARYVKDTHSTNLNGHLSN